MNIYNFQKNHKDIFKQFSLKDILFVYYKCPQKEKIIQLYSPYNQFTFSIGGKKIFHQADSSWTISKDSGFLLKRTAYLEEIYDEPNGWELLAFYIKDNYLKKLFDEFRPHLQLNNLPPASKDMVILMDINDRIRSCYKSLLPYFNQSAPLPESIIELKFRELLYNVLINPANNRIVSYINSLVDGYSNPVWEVMEANFMYDLKLSEFAQLSNKSISTFKREFEQYYHDTPGKWLTGRRLQRAKMFLETSQKTISDIVFESGFKNISHFSRVFKEQYGMSPTKYRDSI
jgi:AraC-like DNA-binding protein